MAESKLISQARAGDGAALGRLLRARQDKLYRTAFLYTRNQVDALDVVQETALQAMLSIKRLRHPEYFDTWLIRILINSAYRLMRSRKPVGDEAPAAAASPDNAAVLHLDLVQDLAALPAKLRDVVILRFFNDLTLQEIGRVLHLPVGTVKSRLNRALQGLREKGEVIHEYDDGFSKNN